MRGRTRSAEGIGRRQCRDLAILALSRWRVSRTYLTAITRWPRQRVTFAQSAKISEHISVRNCVHPPTGTGHICTLERVRAAPRPEIKAAIQSICLKSLVAPPWSGRCRPDAVGGGRERSGTRGTGLCRCATFLEITDVLLSGTPALVVSQQPVAPNRLAACSRPIILSGGGRHA